MFNLAIPSFFHLFKILFQLFRAYIKASLMAGRSTLPRTTIAEVYSRFIQSIHLIE